MAASDALVIEAHRQVLEVRDGLGDRIDALWNEYAGLTDAELAAFVELAVPLVAAAQLHTATVVDAYLAEYLDELPVGFDEAAVTGAGVRAGTPPAEVYGRGVITARSSIANGLGYLDALRIGGTRARLTAETDVMLSQRAATVQVLEARPRLTLGYRRILTGVSCRFCATASTQRYKRGDLMPLHPRCDCGIAPITRGHDPGQDLNGDTLRRLKAKGPEYWKKGGYVDNEGRPISPDDYARRRPIIKEHGELGPTLVAPGNKFTEAADLDKVPASGPRGGDLRSIVSFKTPAAEKAFGPTLDRLSKIHGAPELGNTLPTEIVKGGKTDRLGGSFSPGKRPPKPKRTRGKSPEQYRVEYAAYYNATPVPTIRVNERGDGTNLVSFIHEYGHRLDWRGSGVSVSGTTYKTHLVGDDPVMFSFLDAVSDSPTIKGAYQRYRDPAFTTYYKSAHEVWARAYSQWAAVRLGGPELEALRAFQTGPNAGYQWPDDEFDAIAPHVEAVLKAWGFMT